MDTTYFFCLFFFNPFFLFSVKFSVTPVHFLLTNNNNYINKNNPDSAIWTVQSGGLKTKSRFIERKRKNNFIFLPFWLSLISVIKDTSFFLILHTLPTGEVHWKLGEM